MSPYELLLQELNKQPQAPGPMFTPEQVQQRVGGNNRQMELGVLGQLAGDSRVRGVGGSVFKQALGDRQERVSAQGVMDPLTGEMATNPEYASQKEETRRGQILKQAVDYQNRQEERQFRADQAEENRVFRKSLANIAASNRGGGGGGPKLPKPVAGYMWNADGSAQIAIPGTPQAAKADDVARASGAKGRMAIERADSILSEIARAKEMTGGMTTGIPGAVLSKLYGGKAFDLKKSIDTIKANIGFQELQAMREASPTGGALGQVAVQELVYLQSVLGSLDTLQSEEALSLALDKAATHFNKWKGYMAEASAGGGGADSPPPAAPPGGTAPPAVAPSAAPVVAPPAAPAAPRKVYQMINGKMVPKP